MVNLPDEGGHVRLPVSRPVALVVLIVLPLVLFAPRTNAMQAGLPSATPPLLLPVQTPQMVTFFNQEARPDDIAAFPVTSLHLVAEVATGERMVVFRSQAEVERHLEEVVGQVDWIAFNTEPLRDGVAQEPQALLDLVTRAAEAAQARSLRFALIANRQFAQDHLPALTAEIDLIILDGQRLQEDPQALARWVEKTAALVRGRDGTTRLFAQLSVSHGTPPQLLAALQAVAGRIDGVAIRALPQDGDTVQQVVSLLGSSSPASASGAPGTATPPIQGTAAVDDGEPGELPGMTAGTASLDALLLTFPVQTPAVAAYFNAYARGDDIAALTTEDYEQLLPLLSVGQKLVVFRSATEAVQALPELVGKVDGIGYNAEHWEHTPPDEQADLLAAVRNVADAAHAHDLRFMVIPDLRFAEAHLADIAPYADYIVLQGQRLQADPQSFAALMTRLLAVARTSNPRVRIFVQVGASRGEAQQMLAAIQTVAHEIDGVAVWSVPQSLPILQAFVTLSGMRARSVPTDHAPAGRGAAPGTAEAGVEAADAVVPRDEGGRLPAEANPQQQMVPLTEPTVPVSFTLFGIALAVGCVIVGLVLGFVLADRARREHHAGS